MILIRPLHNQFQDDCQNWLCYFCIEHPPACSLHILKLPFISSCSLTLSGELASGHESTFSPKLPVLEIKKTFLSTNLGSQVSTFSGEQPDPTFIKKDPRMDLMKLQQHLLQTPHQHEATCSADMGISRVKASTQVTWLLIQCSFYCSTRQYNMV